MDSRLAHRAALAALVPLLLLAACQPQSPPADDKAASAHQWTGEAAMISNFGVYRKHEFIFQDYIHDDHGANTDGLDRVDLPFGTSGPDPNNPTDVRMSPAPIINYAGDYLYAAPNNHMDDVADLIEFRVAADNANVYYRIQLADMTAPDSSVVGICVDEDLNPGTGLATWPFGAGITTQLGCDHIYTVFGAGAFVTDAKGASTDLTKLGGAVATDVNDGFIDVRVPKSVADPGKGSWRYFVASGIWDAANQQWSAPTPIPQQMNLPVTSGGRVGAPNVWDLLSNNHEPNSPWNEEKQANDIINQTLLDDYVDVDFDRLANGGDDPDPQLTGVIERIYRSQYPTATGKGTDIVNNVGNHFVYQGPYQPYAVVIPHDYYADPKRAFPFDVCLHPLGGNHNVEVYYSESLARPDYNPLVTGVIPSTGYLGFGQITALVDRLDAVYTCTLGRGEGQGYQGTDGMVDALEVQDNVKRLYNVDDNRRTIHGVSLGAIGTWYVSRLYPDRYSAAMPYIFTSDLQGGTTAAPTLANLYNLPVTYALGTADEFAQGTQGDAEADQMEGFGNEYFFLHYLGGQHEGRIESEFLPFVLQLAYSKTRVVDPPRVKYVFDPAMFNAKIPGTGSAYWVLGMKQRDTAAGAASVDVTSLARADQLPQHQVVLDGEYLNAAKNFRGRMRGLFRMTADQFIAFWHPEQWDPGWQALNVSVTPTDFPPVAKANGFTLTAANLGTVTLDAKRMGLSGGGVSYSVTTDGPLTIQFSDGRKVSFAAAGSFQGSL